MTTPSYREYFHVIGVDLDASIAGEMALQPIESLYLNSPDGIIATCALSGAGDVYVNFWGTSNSSMQAVDIKIGSAVDPAQIPAMADAVMLAQRASSVTIPKARVYVTGFSLGGVFAQYVAWKLGLPGMAFAGAGVPGLANPAASSGTFTTVVARGDYWATEATDLGIDGNPPIMAQLSGKRQDHFGKVVLIGTAADTALLKKAVGEAVAATWPWAPAALKTQATADYNAALAIHNMQGYAAKAQAAGLIAA